MKGFFRVVLSVLLVMLLSVLGFGLWSVLWPEAAQAAVYTVTLTTDTLPVGVPGELRWAINSANATPGVPDTINFAIPAPGVQSIIPLAPLPAIIDTVTIDGYTQPLSSPPAAGTPAIILIELDGTLAGPSDGLVFQLAGASGSVVRGLAVNRFSQNGIFLQGALSVTVEANNIGTDVLGAVPLPNGWEGVYVFGGAAGNTIGGPAAGNRNVISGNLAYGVSIDNAFGNVVEGNYIGTDMNGAAPLPNGLSGVAVVNGSSGNFIGGGAPGQRNVISGNTNDGVYVTGSASNAIQGNYIGTDVTGTAVLSNQGHGVYLINAANANTIGGSAAGLGNLISGNIKFGVVIDNSNSVNVQGNYIGTDVNGTAALANGGSGVFLNNGATGNTIGGATAGHRNLISGNSNSGITAQLSSAGNFVQGNYVGADVNGTAALGNAMYGIQLIAGANSNTVGGSNPGEGNLVSGNVWDGVNIDSSTGNAVQGNYVGTDAAGAFAMPNSGSGVCLSNGASGNTVGGTTAGHRNIISGNGLHGVYMNGAGGNFLQGNYIGLDAAGSASRGNSGDGVNIAAGSNGNTVGGTTSGHTNVISGNSFEGIQVDASTGNTISANYVGLDATGGVSLGNGGTGVAFTNGANSNAVGGITAAERNVISANFYGLHVQASTGCTVYGNYIGTDASGTLARGNQNRGVYIQGANANTLGGTSAAQRNVISGNGHTGVLIENSSGTTFQGNYIGTDATGTASVGNVTYGVWMYNNPGPNTVGGTAAGAGNLVSGNNNIGVFLDNSLGQALEGNYVGTDATGASALGNAGAGIYLQHSAAGNTIGGTTSGHRNVISGNGSHGIEIDDPDGNTVSGNHIGTDAAGTAAVGNTGEGIYLVNGADGNTIGGNTAGHRNIISGNTSDGVEIDGSTGNVLQGNYVGTDAAGTAALPNGSQGVHIDNSANSNTIGGSNPGEGNLISGNHYSGVDVRNSNSTLIYGNYIGTDAAGTAALPNQQGIGLSTGASSTAVGGSNPGEGNLVSGNSSHGIEVAVSSGNNVEGNLVGTDAAGTAALPNGNYGVRLVNGANSNTIGGTTAGHRNVISGNGYQGISIHNGSTGNAVEGNYIGTDVTGTASVPNSAGGVYLTSGANSNTIGGTTAGHRNVISGNASDGVEIDGSTGNSLYGNYVGTNAAGAAALANGGNGVYFLNGANNNTVGGATAGQGNLISGNASDGVEIDGSTGSFIYGNCIGTNAAGTSAVPNGNHGVYLLNGVNGTTIGGASATQRNVISGNTRRGIRIDNGNANSIKGNYVGVDATGAAALGNLEDGIYVMNGGSVTIGGGAAGEGNVISGNGADGIEIDTSTGNTIQGNRIGTDAAGTADLGNAVNGIHFWNCYSSTIGGSTVGQGNLVCGNDANGIQLNNYSYSNVIQGNYVGTDVNGGSAISNGQRGIYVYDVSNNNIIGGATAAERNLVSGNTGNGIEMDDSTGNFIRGNYVGTNWNGTAALANGSNGVYLRNAANTNTIGGTTAGQGNLISGNSHNGIRIEGSTNNDVQGNLIGTNVSGLWGLGNGWSGVELFLSADNNTIGGGTTAHRNVISGNTASGVTINTSCTGNQVQGNYIGTDAAGTSAVANLTGVYFNNNSNGNTIGGATAGQGNLISGNTWDGLVIDGSTGNFLQGNYVGTDAAGTVALPNGDNGVCLVSGANTNTIGGSGAGEGNLVSGNASDGVEIDGSTGNFIYGNRIGTDAAGTSALANGANGVYLLNGANTNAIGGATAGHRNLISGNGHDGVHVENGAANSVRGNYIGTGADGATAVANGGDGIDVVLSANNTIGGATAGERNVVSGNLNHGVDLFNSTGNYIRGNYVGTDLSGTSAVPNGSMGVYLINYSDGNTIGGSGAGEGNLVSGNTYDGIVIYNSRSNVVQGNRVGTDAAGTSAVPNGDSGIYLIGIAGTPGNTIGGSGAGEGNLVSGNASAGIRLNDADGNVLRGNRVGTDASGTSALPNGDGLYLHDNTDLNTIGGSAAGEGNLISGNASEGVKISNATRNVFEGNRIGTEASGTSHLPNGGKGFYLQNGANTNTIGGATAGQRNIISGNYTGGIEVNNSSSNVLQGNYLGTDASGTGALPNWGDGVYIVNAANTNTVGGSNPGEGNLISGNVSNGVRLVGSTGNNLQGNCIGTNAAGTAALANNGNGVYLTSGADANTIGGSAAGQGNLISGNGLGGIHIFDSDGNGIQGNYIGTNAAGTAALPNTHGILVTNNAGNNTIGGAAAGEGNLISGNGNDGVSLEGATGNTIQGNRIGTDATGTAALPNGSDGVSITGGSTDCEVSHNTIASNTGIGVVVWDAGSIRNEVSRNSLYGNGGLGIDLMGDGVTPNDGNNNNPAKPDRGYNFPVFSDTAFALVGGNVNVSGTAPPNALVEFYYVGPAQDLTGHGEGLTWLGWAGAHGDGSFSTTLTGLAAGDWVSAVAVSPAGDPSGEGNTSEFSLNAQVRTGHTVDASVTGGNGDVDPDTQVVIDGRDATIALLPDAHYHPASITDNGVPAAVADPYVINNVTAYHDVVVTYAIDTFDVDASVSGTGGTVDPATQDIAYGSPASIDLVPDADYHVESVTDNGIPAAVADPYVIEPVTEAHTVVVTFAPDVQTWYLAEGCTGGDFETWVLVQNPGAAPVTVDLTFMTSTGEVPGPQGLAVPGGTRHSFNVNSYVADWDVSTRVDSAGGDVICERAMYGGGRAWAHDSIGTTTPAPAWYLAEGCTGGDFETWVLVQNPGAAPVTVDLTFMTSTGEVPGPQGYAIPGGTRHSFRVNDCVTDWDVSTRVEASGDVICERAMYGGSRTWAHDSIGVTTPAPAWYLAEGCTGGDFETWVLVQNPGAAAVSVDLTFMTSTGEVPGPQGYAIPGGTRHSFRVNDCVTDWDVSTRVEASGDVICERAMYGGSRTWAHDSIGVTDPDADWYLAEGCTGGDFETWVLVQNPGTAAVTVDLTFMTSNGEQAGPQGYVIPGGSRHTFKVNDYVTDWDVSTRVEASGDVICERAMYGGNRTWAHDSIGYAP